MTGTTAGFALESTLRRARAKRLQHCRARQRWSPQTMITCERCKTENLDGSQYCDECGAPLRPNGKHGLGQRAHNNGDRPNGSQSASPGPRPEFAGGHISANLNLASLKPPSKPHARLVIE